MNPIGPIVVLVLDDEESIRDSLAEFLEDCGHRVHSFERAEDALAFAALGQVRVAIVDIRLPGMDGIAFIKAVHAKHAEIVYLIHTGSMDFQLDADLRAIGLRERDVFFKPVLDMRVFDECIQRKVRHGSFMREGQE